MTPLIYNPSWDRQQLWREAQSYIHAACWAWSLPEISLKETPPPGARKFGTGGTYFGYWSPPNRIFVNVARATSPVRVRGRVWSYPGYKIDRTCAGILAHEFGHHAAGSRKMDVETWRRVVDSTKPVTGYEPTLNEAFAESMRIFTLNPDLLRLARPARYAYIIQYFSPLHNSRWEEVLRNAPEFLITQAEKFCAEGQRGLA